MRSCESSAARATARTSARWPGSSRREAVSYAWVSEDTSSIWGVPVAGECGGRGRGWSVSLALHGSLLHGGGNAVGVR